NVHPVLVLQLGEGPRRAGISRSRSDGDAAGDGGGRAAADEEDVKTAVIVNPRSASGRTARRWPEVAAALEARLGAIETRFTKRPGHAIEIARELLAQGFDPIVAAGGDGTINEVANGFLENEEPVRPGARLGILPLGTGGDFRRSLGISREIPEAIEAIARGVSLPIDIGKAAFRGASGGSKTRNFVNLLSFGMGGEVASRAKNLLNPLGGSAAFLYATAGALM